MQGLFMLFLFLVIFLAWKIIKLIISFFKKVLSRKTAQDSAQVEQDRPWRLPPLESHPWQETKSLPVSVIPSAPVAVTIKAPSPLTPDEFYKKHTTAYVAFDLETTGLDASSARIIEIGAVKIIDGQETDCFHTLVNPGRGWHIPPEASAVNHITDEMVASAPGYGTTVPRFLDFIGDFPLVAHNATFDIKFLYAAFSELNIPKPLTFADSLKMARQWFPSLPNKKLSTVCDAIGYQIGQAHRALDDARAVHTIVQACARQAALMSEWEYGYKAHFDLAKQIEAANQQISAHPQNARTHEDTVLLLCRKDFDTVEPARAYHQAHGWPDPRFDSFRRAIIIYTRRGDFENAIAVCRRAVALDIPDKDTVGGMAGRLEKLIAKQQAAAEKEALARAKAAKKAEREALAMESAPANAGKRPVLQFSFDGAELLQSFESVAAAAQAVGVDKSCIRDAAKGKQKHAAGFSWKYADEYSAPPPDGTEM